MKRLLAFAIALLAPLAGWAQINSYTNFQSGTAPSFEGVWWNAAESGWGVSVQHQGDILFAVWYTYDHDGTPMWLVMPNASLVDTGDNDMMGMMEMSMMGMSRNPPIYTGTLYRSSGPAYSNATFDPNAVGVTAVGMGTFMFNAEDNGVFAYTVGNYSSSKKVSRMVFSSVKPKCSVGGLAKSSRANYQDIWWRPSESGWGVNIAHQGDTLFATWFTYDSAGKGMWLVMSNVAKTAQGRYSGKVYRTKGPAFDTDFDASKVQAIEVGAASFTFSDTGGGSFAYTVDGVTQTKAIERMVFTLPASVCD